MKSILQKPQLIIIILFCTAFQFLRTEGAHAQQQLFCSTSPTISPTEVILEDGQTPRLNFKATITSNTQNSKAMLSKFKVSIYTGTAVYDTLVQKDIPITSVTDKGNNQYEILSSIPIDTNIVNKYNKDYGVYLFTDTNNYVNDQTGNKCFTTFKTTSNPNNPKHSTCYNLGYPQNHFECFYNNTEGWKINAINTRCQSGYSSIDCNAFNLEMTDPKTYCIPCIENGKIPTGTKKHGENCSNDSDCLVGLKCKDIVGKKCTKNELSVPYSGKCIIGGNECIRSIGSTPGIVGCVASTSGNTPPQNWDIGTEGTCKNFFTDIKYTCQTPDYCDEQKSILVKAGVPVSYSTCRSGVCLFEEDPVNTDPNATPSAPPPEPQVSNRGIEGCNGILECINCVARKCTSADCGPTTQANETERFKSVSEAADFALNKSDQIVYTNNVYLAIGCVDTSYQGVVVRLLQIGLGVVGGVMALRFGQAIFYLQRGDPESYKEGSEIIWSAFIALFVLLLSVVGLSFIGINLLGLFSPGTIGMS